MKPREKYPPTGNDPYARESNTFRRMRPWQAWTLGGVAVGFVVIAVLVT